MTRQIGSKSKKRQQAARPSAKAGRRLSFQEAKAKAVKQYAGALAKLAK